MLLCLPSGRPARRTIGPISRLSQSRTLSRANHGVFATRRAYRVESLLGAEIQDPHVVKQRRAPLCGERMIALQKQGKRLPIGPDRDLRVYPGLFFCLIPRVPCDRSSLPVFTTCEIYPKKKLHRRLAAHVLSPDLDLVAVARDRLRMLEYPRFGADKVEGDLLRALASLDIGRVLIFVDTMYKTAFPSRTE